MFFPETMEDIILIVDMYDLTEWNVEIWVEMLTEYLDELECECRGFLNESSDLDNYSEEAREYSEECSKLSQELASRVEYDVTLEVVVEDLAWECAYTAALADELEAQGQELIKLVEVIDAHGDVVRTYRDLLQQYLCRGEQERYWIDSDYED